MPRRLLACLAIAAVLTASFVASAQSRRARLLLISIDGLMPSSYLSPESRATTLRRLAARGVWATGVTGVWPTNTRPSHTTLITGVPPGLHGIIDNDPLDPEGQMNRTFNWFARDIRVPTLISASRAAGLSTAVVMWPVSVGADANYLVPAFEWQHPRDHNLLRALSTPRLLEDFEHAIGAPFVAPPTDLQRVGLATFIARTHRPDLLLLYVGTLDAYQHTYGPGAEMTESALRSIDDVVGRMLMTLESEELLEDTFVAVVSDHGYVEVDHTVAPNALLKQNGLIETDSRGRITRWQAFSLGSGGSSLVYVKDRSDHRLFARVRSILDSLAADAQAGIDRILTRHEVVAAGSDPEAAFGITMRPGYSLTTNIGPLFGPPYIRAMHGYPPTHAAMNASFIIAGPGLADKGDIGTVRMTQIAPTLARLLGISLSPKADSPIDAILRAALK